MTSDKDAKCPRCDGPCVNVNASPNAEPVYRSTHAELMAAALDEQKKRADDHFAGVVYGLKTDQANAIHALVMKHDEKMAAGKLKWRQHYDKLETDYEAKMAAVMDEMVSLDDELLKRITELEQEKAELAKSEIMYETKMIEAQEHNEILQAENERLRLQLSDKKLELSSDLYGAGYKKGKDHANEKLAKEWDADPKIVFGLINKLRGQVDEQMEVVEWARDVLRILELVAAPDREVNMEAVRNYIKKGNAALDTPDKKEKR